MKLWQKISIISILVLLLVVTLCSSFLLLYAKNHILEITIENLRIEQQNLERSFLEILEYYLRGETNPVALRSGAKYCFSQFAKETSVLIFEGEALYSAININPWDITPIKDDHGQQESLKRIDNRNIYIAGSRVPTTIDDYYVYVVKDITGIYNKIISMAWWFSLFSITGIALGTFLIILLVNKTLRPLTNLKNTTGRIAIGEYGERANIHSKDEVGELAKDFNSMAEAIELHIKELEDKAQRLRLFIDGVTHEFKTPMTSMLIHTDTLLSMDLDEENKTLSLLHIHEQCRWLERLTQKLLKLTALEEEVDKSPESIEELFLDVSNTMAETLAKRNISLKTYSSVERLNLDYDLIKSLLINLLDNASKASKLGQHIELKAYGRTIEVKDFGIGISKEEIDHIMDPFYRVDSSRSKGKGGSGLGLALVERIAHGHDAQIFIHSEIGEGTSFQIKFPP
ncbi:MAG: HAMP domain-containing histidine kinase [Clostridiales bacterium]|nr:HAMP domain-containing histidine kinase [Clostridiales bacterium]